MAKFVDRLRALVAAGLATALVAWVVFLVLPDLWDAIEWYAPRIDWAFWFVVALLGLYLIFFYSEAENGLETIRARLSKRDYRNLPKAIFSLFAFPGLLAIFILPSALLELVGYLANRTLSSPAQTILFRSIGVLALMWMAVYGILIFSNLWQQEVDQCKWVFPKILSCLLTKNDGLAGGLIGAGGTIFAGWLAWAAIQEQIVREGIEKKVRGKKKP